MIRFFDCVLSLIGIILLTPLFILVALIIFIEDRGPVFFLQNRVGRNLEKFKIIKFRSMKHLKDSYIGDMANKNTRTNLHELRKQVSTNNNNDTRITKVGKFIRKTSIDELPQLINVLKNDMSLVGPRPDTPIQEIDYLPQEWSKRHLVKPGITGLSQINGRSNISFNDRVKLDIEYALNPSFQRYIKILLKTSIQLFSLKGIN